MIQRGQVGETTPGMKLFQDATGRPLIDVVPGNTFRLVVFLWMKTDV
jgi:hypothetical protein